MHTRLPRLLSDLVRLTLATTALAACGGTTSEPGGRAGGSRTSSPSAAVHTPSACYPHHYGWKPGIPVDYVAYGRPAGGPALENVWPVGVACAHAGDPSDCERRLGALTGAYVYTRGDEVGAITTPEEIAAFLAPIDTLDEAGSVAQAARYQCWICDSGNQSRVSETPDGYVVERMLHASADGRESSATVTVSRDGSLTTSNVAEVTSICDHGTVSEGRRPEGLEPVATPGGNDLGRYFARVAHLEAASVVAFRRLEVELRAHGAPEGLLTKLRAARADEIRHARATRRIARRFGNRPAPVRVAEARPRTLVEIAIENITEGCVRETFGAMVALFRAQRAADTEIATAWQGIAVDESRHASLSWELAEWLDERITADERRAVDDAFEAAVAALDDELGHEPPHTLALLAGAPNAREERALFACLSDAVFHQARPRCA